MERFETFFEDNSNMTLASENFVNDYAKWWEDAFLPHMKEKMEKLRYNCEHVDSLTDIEYLRKQLDEGEKRCRDLINNPSSLGNVLKGYFAYMVGNGILAIITLPFGGIGSFIALIVDIASRETGDGPFSRIEKSAKVGLEVIKTCRGILDKKEKEFKAAEKKSKK